MDNDQKKNISIFLLRLILGLIFVAHGSQKIFGMFDGIGLEGAARMMEGLGFIYPYLIAIIWSGVEFFGGICLIFGIFTRFAAGFNAALMLITILKINFSYGFFAQNGGVEYSLLILVSCVILLIMGAGNLSVWEK